MTRNTMAVVGSAATVAACALALAGCAAWAFPKLHRMPALWCFVPLVWCIWAVLAPKEWVPERLPLWGAVLAVIGWLGGVMIVNVPSRVAGLELPVLTRALAGVPLAALYYLLWMAVRAVYRQITFRA